MTLSEQDRFLAASKVFEGYYNNAVHNAEVIRRGGDLNEIIFSDTKGPLRCLSKEVDGKKSYYLLGVILPTKKMAWIVMDQLYHMHGQMVTFEALVRFLKSGKGNEQAVRDLRVFIDSFLFYSKTLAETCLHFSRVAADRKLSELILLAQMGMVSQTNPLTKEQIAETEVTLKAVVQAYIGAINQGLKEVLAKSFDQAKMHEHIKSLPSRLCQYPCWMVRDDEPGSKIINNVWLPKESAEPLMKKLIDEQVRAMAARTSKAKE